MVGGTSTVCLLKRVEALLKPARKLALNLLNAVSLIIFRTSARWNENAEALIPLQTQRLPSLHFLFPFMLLITFSAQVSGR